MKNVMYILDYQVGDKCITRLHWTKESAIIDFFTVWLNTKTGLSGEMAREAWNMLVEEGCIPEVGSITEAEVAPFVNSSFVEDFENV